MKRVIVIGATSGIGCEMTHRFISAGWHVGIAARRIHQLEEIRKSADVEIMQIDVRNDEAPRKLLALIDKLGGVDLLFYASGIGKQNMRLDADIELSTCATNVSGFTRMIDTVYNYMTENGGGHIAIVSSIAGTKGLGVAPSYSATKAYQSTYIQALEQQANMRGLPIRFTDIRPGFVDTPLLDGGNYPMLMTVGDVAREIMHAIDKQYHVRVIDRRYRLLTFFWRLVPNRIWRKLKIGN